MNRKNKEEYNTYMRKYHLKRYRRLRNEAITFLGGKCVKCGSTEKLELDHINKDDKEIEVSKMLSVSLDRFWKEVKKCQLLCKGCHLDKTIVERGHKIAKGTHGTLSSYRYCKCELCKKAHRDWSIKYNKSHKRITINGERVVVPR